MNDQQEREKYMAMYNKLSQQYSPEELVEYFVFPNSLTGEEKEQAGLTFKKLRMAQLRNLTEEEVIFNGLLRMKYRIEDYLRGSTQADEFSFGNQLKNYLQITKRSQGELGKEINVDKTKFSKLINNRIKPSIEICMRLQKHSDEILPAKLWFKLHLKSLELALDADPQLKEEEYRQVTSSLSLGMTG